MGEPLKEGRSVRVPEDKRLHFDNFTGEVMVKYAGNGKALLLVIHADGRRVNFETSQSGWMVT